MDNSHNDYRAKKRGVGNRFKSKPNKFKTVINTDGSERIIKVKSSSPIKRRGRKTEKVTNVNLVQKPLKLKLQTNEDGSESVIDTNQINNENEVIQELEQEQQFINENENENSEIMSEQTENFGGKKRKKKIDGIGNMLKMKVTKKPVKKKSVGGATLAFTKPLLPTMKIGLKSKGIAVSGLTNMAVIEKFYNEFVSNKNDKNSSFEQIPDGFLENHYLMNADYDNFDSDNIGGLAAIQTLAGIGKAGAGKIKGFIKTRKENKARKKAGLPPIGNKVEDLMGASGEKVLTDLEKKEAEKKPVETKTVKYIIFGVVGLAVLGLGIFLMRRK